MHPSESTPERYDDYALGQVLLVAAEVPSRVVERELSALQFVREDASPGAGARVTDGTQQVVWRWRGGQPSLSCSFHPATRIHALAVGAVPPRLRGALAQRLELVPSRRVAVLLQAPDTTARLQGVRAAHETERIDLLAPIARLTADADGAVARAAEETSAYLRRVADARLVALAQLQIPLVMAEALIPTLSTAASVEELRPRPADCAMLFDAEVADAVSRKAAQVWQHPPLASPRDPASQLKVTAATSGMLRFPNELSNEFPLGYRDIAGWMAKERVWVTWRWSEPGGTTRYDGLVWVQDHWIWLPKVFRLLRREAQPAA